MEEIMSATKSKTLHEHLDRETAALGKEIERLAEIVRQAAKEESGDIAKLVGDTARDIAARAGGLANHLAGEFSDRAGAIKDAAGKGRAQVEDVIRDRPLTAVGLAALAGFLLAAVVRR
jgi:ElaB/YqjD/DUF883 family membrane-anchored ribosome-binding protein